MTNYERIKQMSIEEMAYELAEEGFICEKCIYQCKENHSCREACLHWLNEEAK